MASGRREQEMRVPRSERNNASLAAGATSLAAQFRATRALSEALVAPLSDADASLQSMEDASPAKWHLAHPTWFWETFLLRDKVAGYQLFNPDWPFLFNSYYEAEGARISRVARGLLSRPTLAAVREWRAAVDDALSPLLDDPALAGLIALGIAHEQQHIELPPLHRSAGTNIPAGSRWSGTRARVSPSTMKARATACYWNPSRWLTGW
jgi:hypothetical protein